MSRKNEILSSWMEVQKKVTDWKRKEKIALIPTMGSLHQGHIALIQSAFEEGGRVVVSIFVNPIQFGKNEDFEKYPRGLEQDQEKIAEIGGVDLIFSPLVEDIYPKGFETFVQVGKTAEYLCGQFRPGHFSGVATVCLKLFQITQPDFVVFGEKDFQQARVIENMIKDFHLPMEIKIYPTVREEDGLARSSRNQYLTTEERKIASIIPKAGQLAVKIAKDEKEITIAAIKKEVIALLQRHEIRIEYVEIASSKTLIPASDFMFLRDIERPRLFLALYVGQTRLIDNRELV